MAHAGGSGGLQTIFSFFLGLMVTAFIGVGVYTFHPPEKEFDRQIQSLDRQEQAIRASRPATELTVAERDQIQELTNARTEAMDAAQEARNDWGRRTSVVLIVLATLTMAVSLVRADQLPVISNGLLLGGVFTMVYGVGWIVTTDTSITRFLVMTVALAITLGLGYMRFVRRGAVSAVTAAPAIPDAAGHATLERRVRDLEERMFAAASALGPKSDSRGRGE